MQVWSAMMWAIIWAIPTAVACDGCVCFSLKGKTCTIRFRSRRRVTRVVLINRLCNRFIRGVVCWTMFLDWFSIVKSENILTCSCIRLAYSPGVNICWYDIITTPGIYVYSNYEMFCNTCWHPPHNDRNYQPKGFGFIHSCVSVVKQMSHIQTRARNSSNYLIVQWISRSKSYHNYKYRFTLHLSKHCFLKYARKLNNITLI